MRHQIISEKWRLDDYNSVPCEPRFTCNLHPAGSSCIPSIPTYPRTCTACLARPCAQTCKPRSTFDKGDVTKVRFQTRRGLVLHPTYLGTAVGTPPYAVAAVARHTCSEKRGRGTPRVMDVRTPAFWTKRYAHVFARSIVYMVKLHVDFVAC